MREWSGTASADAAGEGPVKGIVLARGSGTQRALAGAASLIGFGLMQDGRSGLVGATDRQSGS